MQEARHTREEEDEAESEEYCPNEEEDEEADGEERHGRAYTGDYYAPEDNGNSVRVSPYRGRKVVVVEGETGEEAEEDIDQIVAEIKMSMSMGSLSSGTDQSPEEMVQEPTLSDYSHSKPGAAPYPPAHHRHDSRPKSLNLPSIHQTNPDLQRDLKAQPASPEDRQRWTEEAVSCFRKYLQYSIGQFNPLEKKDYRTKEYKTSVRHFKFNFQDFLNVLEQPISETKTIVSFDKETEIQVSWKALFNNG